MKLPVYMKPGEQQTETECKIVGKSTEHYIRLHFYSVSALLAMQTAVIAREYLLILPSVCLSFRCSGVLSTGMKI